MARSNGFLRNISWTWVKETKYDFHPLTYKFNLTDLKPNLGEPFSYFAQAPWSDFSAIGSSTTRLPVVRCSSTELIPNERANDYN